MEIPALISEANVPSLIPKMTTPIATTDDLISVTLCFTRGANLEGRGILNIHPGRLWLLHNRWRFRLRAKREWWPLRSKPTTQLSEEGVRPIAESPLHGENMIVETRWIYLLLVPR